MLPSVYVVYKTVYTQRAKQSNVYFFIWTQVGSLIALMPIVYISATYGDVSYVGVSKIQFSHTESFVLYTMFFVGFGVKAPI